MEINDHVNIKNNDSINISNHSNVFNFNKLNLDERLGESCINEFE